MDKQITIRMPKELLAKWLAALRSGEYRQCTTMLSRDGGFCCLGVLQKVGSDQVEEDGLPSKGWLDAHGVQFADNDFDWGFRCPYLPSLATSAADANDSGMRFAEIADVIEQHAEGV